MIWLLLPAFATERVATRLAGETEGGFGTVSDLAATSDGAFVGFPSGGSTFWVLDTGSWSLTEVPVCDGTAGAAARIDSDKNYWFYTGCSDGTVVPIEVTSSGSASKSSSVWTAGSGAVKAVEADDSYVYAVYGSSSSWQATAFSATDGTVKTGYPVTLNLTSLSDTILFPTLLIALDGTSNFAKVDLSTNTPSTTAGDYTYYRWVEGWNYNDTDLYLADSGGRFGYVNPSNNVFQSQVQVSPDVSAVGITRDGAYILAGTSTGTQVYGFSDLSLKTSLTDASGVKEFAAIDGYMFGIDQDGEIDVITERPWVEVTSVSDSSAASGAALSVAFSSDTSGTWEFRVGGDADGSGTLLDSGSISAGETLSSSVTVDDSFAEGINRLWIFVKDANGNVGHDAGSIYVNNPPGSLDLSLGFGDQEVTAQFAALPDDDIAEYDFYLSTIPFSADDWSTGGPAYEGPDKGLNLDPSPPGDGDRITRTFYPLTNNTTYYVAVRALDETGLEGPMSKVKSATPLPTYGAAELAGDKGGFCGIEAEPGGLLLLAGGLIAALRRRSGTLLGIGLGVLLLPAAAHAHSGESPKTSTISLRYGPVTIDDSKMKEVYGTTDQELLRLEYGLTSDYIEGTIGLGFFQELGSQYTSDGTASDEHVMMTIWPINMDVVGKLDLIKEQPLVPFARVGLDAWMWNENWGSRLPDATIPYDHIAGGKFGWHYGFGGMLLLDTFDRQTADRVEANTGINDTYLVGEFRKTTMFKSDGLSFDSTEISFGLRLDM